MSSFRERGTHKGHYHNHNIKKSNPKLKDILINENFQIIVCLAKNYYVSALKLKKGGYNDELPMHMGSIS